MPVTLKCPQIQSQRICFQNFLGTCPRTPSISMLHMLIALHTITWPLIILNSLYPQLCSWLTWTLKNCFLQPCYRLLQESRAVNCKFGWFIEYQKWYILHTCNMVAFDLPDMYPLMPILQLLHVSGIHIFLTKFVLLDRMVTPLRRRCLSTILL